MLSKVINEMRTQPVSFAGSIASLIALINTYFAAPTLVTGLHTPPIINANPVIILCCFFALEGALASVFSKIYVKLRDLGPGWPFISICITALISAWVTGYNCVWMFSSFAEHWSGNLFIFISTLIVGWLVSVYFLKYHFSQVQKSSKAQLTGADLRKINEDFWVSFFINLGAFVFVAFYLGNYVADLPINT